MSKISLLGVNIDHVATIRQARRTSYPSIVDAALQAENGGADGITVHLREDRRHIQDPDVIALKEKIQTRLNLEMAVTQEMLDFACRIQPAFVCLVPEKRRELTTEGGLDVVTRFKHISSACEKLMRRGICVSLFVDPDEEQIKMSKETGAEIIELHTGAYANATESSQTAEMQKLFSAAKFAQSLNLVVNAGHGLHYQNISQLSRSRLFYEFNIGHAIVARSLFVGIYQAVAEMRKLLQ